MLRPPCVAWNASAADLQSALVSLTTIDDVIVERFGSGGADSEFGYTYSVYFNGNMLQTATYALPALVPVYTTQTNGGPGSCDSFAYFDNGVLTEFSVDANVTQTFIHRQGNYSSGFSLSAANTTAASLKQAFALLPKAIQVSDLRRSLSDDSDGFAYSVVFDISMGDVPNLVCGMDKTMTLASGSCTPKYPRQWKLHWRVFHCGHK